MAHPSADRFCFLGRFLAFEPGEKSPYQRLSLAVAQSSDPAQLSVAERENCQIRLSKSLRQMMYRYLEPQDWIKVVGSSHLNKRSGQLEWKATEIFKLAPHQVEVQTQIESQILESQIQSLENKSLVNRPAKPKPRRVLICQKSDCRRRGSFAVSEAIAAAMAEAGCPVTIQATGCMKRCKEGPNLVLPGGDRHSRVTPQRARSLVQQILPSL